MNFEEKVTQAITDLHQTQAQQINHLLALEAFCQSLIPLLSTHQATQALEAYETGLDSIASQMPPKFQRPAKWEDLRLSLQRRSQAPQQPPR